MALMFIGVLCCTTPAMAGTYCVNKPGCVGSPQSDLQMALTAAESDPGSTVEIGDGTYYGPFSYLGSGSGDWVHIEGTAGATILTNHTAGGSQTVLSVSGTAGSTVSNLSIRIPGEDGDTGLLLGSDGGTAQAVQVSDEPLATHALGVNLVGGTLGVTFMGDDASHKAQVHLQENSTYTSTGIQALGKVTMNDVIVSGTGVLNGVSATTDGVDPTAVTMQRAFVQAAGPIDVDAANVDASMTLQDALLVIPGGLSGGSAVLVDNDAGSNADFHGYHLTVEGGGSTADAVHVEQSDTNPNGATATAWVSDSIIGHDSLGPGHPLDVTGAGPAGNPSRTTGSVAFSDADTSSDIVSTSDNATLDDGWKNVNVDPGFVANDDFHLATSSPLIDAANQSNVYSGGGPQDLDGNDRIVNGTGNADCTAPNDQASEPCPDMGAYEYQPGVAGGGGGGPSAPSATTRDPLITDGYNVTLQGTVNPNGQDTHWHFAYGDSLSDMTNNLPPVDDSNNLVSGTGDQPVSHPLAVDPKRNYCYELVATNASGTTDGTGVCFQSPGAPPNATTVGADILNSQNIHLKGTVNPEGQDTHFHFQYGPDLDHMPNDVPSTVGNDLGPMDWDYHNVAYASLSVTPGQQTCFRLVADNASGVTYATDSGIPPGKGLCVTTKVDTPPTVKTLIANASTPNSIDLSGSVIPNTPVGDTTTWYFRYWTQDDQSDAKEQPAEPGTTLIDSSGTPVTGSAETPVHTTITQLTPNTTYHYELFATNPGGTRHGDPLDAKTAAAPAPPPSSGNYGVQGVDPGAPVIELTFGDANEATHWEPGTRKSYSSGWAPVLQWGCSPGTHGTVSHCAVTATGLGQGQSDWLLGDHVPYGGNVDLPELGHDGRFNGQWNVDCEFSGCDYQLRAVVTTSDGTTVTRKYYVTVHGILASTNVQVSTAATAVLTTVVKGSASALNNYAPVTYRTIKDKDGNVVALLGSDGSVIGGEIIAAGSGNVIDTSRYSIIAAGSGNVVGAGSGNVIYRDGKAIGGIIAAGSGKIKIVDKSGIIAAGSGNIIAAGSGNIIAAGSGNIIAAGSGNIIAAGAHNIIAAGSGNLGSVTQILALSAEKIEQNVAGIDSFAISEGTGSDSFARRSGARAAAHHARPRLAQGIVKFPPGQHREQLILVLTKQGRRVLNKLAGQNAKRHRQHKPLRHLTITVAERITPLRGAKPRTVVKRIKVAPLRHH